MDAPLLPDGGPERERGRAGAGGVTIINGSPAMLMVRRTIGFILCHMLPTAAQTGRCRQGLFCLAETTITMGLVPARVTAAGVLGCGCEPRTGVYSGESLIGCSAQLVVPVTDTPLMLQGEFFFFFCSFPGVHQSKPRAVQVQLRPLGGPEWATILSSLVHVCHSWVKI